ncbi:FmdB family zinc ribbon protein [Agilicoccus flavus]|uniref:FmdB family zinc ribbon protein n=1 Tax=Agilicoccus flavus TaxID=2775968 RepID=UPI001CF6FDAA|nr:FmdB family zinc ribbon protein [Agilicoccus flavus]
MPTYAYACTQCPHTFDVVQSFSDDALTTCPECEGRLRKVFNAVGVVFKGSGFYRTDSRAGASGTDGSKSSGSNGSGSTGSGSESKSSSTTSKGGDSGSSSTSSASTSSAATAS